MKRVLQFAAMVPMLLLAARADDTTHWGDPVNGLRIGVSSPAASVDANSNPTFTVTVQNVSAHPIAIPTWETFLLKTNPDTNDFHETPLEPVIKDTAPNPPSNLNYPSPTYTISDSGPSVGTCIDHVQTLAPGESVVWNSMPVDQNSYRGDRLPANEKTSVQHWWLLPGRQYDIQFQFSNEQANVAKTAVWTGSALSGPTRLSVNMPNRGDIKLDSHFSLPKQRYFIGEPIEVTFTVTNTGTSTIAYPYGGDYRSTGRPDRFTITAVDAGGKAVPDPVKRGGMGGGLGSAVTLKPGESHEDKLMANHWLALTAPGTYSLTCKRTLNVIPNADKVSDFYSTPEADNPAFPIENTFQITLEDDPAALKAYLEKIAPSWQHQPAPVMEPEVYESFTCLALAQNEAAFPVIVSFLDGSPQSQEFAARFLGLYPVEKIVPVLTEHFSKLTPRAQAEVLNGLWSNQTSSPQFEPLLITSLKSRDPDLRLTAVQFCAYFKMYQNCIPILLSMQADPDPRVRSAVAQAFNQSDDKRAIPVLLRLLQDSDPETKISAADSLGHFKRMDGVPVLIKLLQDPKMRDKELNIIICLQRVTGKDLDNREKWLDWWKTTGSAEYEK